MSGLGYSVPAGFPSLTVSGLSLAIDASTGSTSASGTVTFLGVTTDVLVSSALHGGATPSFLLGLHVHNFALGTLVPNLSPTLAGITVPDMAFAYADVPAGTTLTIDGANLSTPEANFFESSFGLSPGDLPSFSLDLAARPEHDRADPAQPAARRDAHGDRPQLD